MAGIEAMAVCVNHAEQGIARIADRASRETSVTKRFESKNPELPQAKEVELRSNVLIPEP
jgi:hypothetical protein